MSLDRKRDSLKQDHLALGLGFRGERVSAGRRECGSKAIIARKPITAPFDGYLGIRQVDLGQYLNPGAPIVPLQSLDPIYVEFALPQQHLEPGRRQKAALPRPRWQEI